MLKIIIIIEQLIYHFSLIAKIARIRETMQRNNAIPARKHIIIVVGQLYGILKIKTDKCIDKYKIKTTILIRITYVFSI